ncbi:MAG: hypothetical protein ACXW3U_11890 [Rhodoplanes sp.]
MLDLNQCRSTHVRRLFSSSFLQKRVALHGTPPSISLPSSFASSGSAMKGTIELVAGTGLDENDIEEIQNAIEAALQGTRYEELFSVTSTREIESDTSMYYLRVSVPFGGITDDYADMQHRLQSSLLCHVEFASQ